MAGIVVPVVAFCKLTVKVWLVTVPVGGAEIVSDGVTALPVWIALLTRYELPLIPSSVSNSAGKALGSEGGVAAATTMNRLMATTYVKIRSWNRDMLALPSFSEMSSEISISF